MQQRITYEGILIRPPSEAKSLIIQATIGCSHNKCTFCGAYLTKKFRIRNFEEIKRDLQIAKNSGYKPRRIFLADGDALSMPYEELLRVLKEINYLFPEIERVSVYATPQNLLEKTEEQLKILRENKLEMVYLGVETGWEELLRNIKKGVNREEMITAAKKAKKAGIKLSVTIILGLAGKENSLTHAKETASILNEIQPDYIGALTLIIIPGTILWKKRERGEFKELTPFEYLEEMGVIISNLNLYNGCIFRSNHASNYLPIGGRLPEDKEEILKFIKEVISRKDTSLLRPEFLRGL